VGKILKGMGASVEIYRDRRAMGKAAGQKVESLILACLEKKKEVRIIAAAAPSQNEVLGYLASSKLIHWPRVTAFHMDEYIGLSRDAPQGFGNFLRDRLFGKVPFKKVHYLQGGGDPAKECERYAALLKRAPIDVLICGIGENGHLAFNDPPVADFGDPLWVKAVNLDPVCRKQQVHDGCFLSLKEVPRQALTLTIPVLMNTSYAVCVVPGSTKAAAAARMILGPVEAKCPASILRLHPSCTVFMDAESGKDLVQDGKTNFRRKRI
jgi:glucosamine-6-phosphate deaminase